MRDVRCSEDPAHHGDSHEPRRSCAGNILRLDSPDQETRSLPRLRSQRRDTNPAERGAGVGLGGSRSQRPDPPVVCRCPAKHLVVAANRRPDQEARRRNAPRQRGCQIIGAEMDSCRTNRQGDVEPVVEEERYGQHRQHSPGEFGQQSVVECFEPQLHRRGSSGHGSLTEWEWVPPGQDGIVGDEQETEDVG